MSAHLELIVTFNKQVPSENDFGQWCNFAADVKRLAERHGWIVSWEDGGIAAGPPSPRRRSALLDVPPPEPQPPILPQ